MECGYLIVFIMTNIHSIFYPICINEMKYDDISPFTRVQHEQIKLLLIVVYVKKRINSMLLTINH